MLEIKKLKESILLGGDELEKKKKSIRIAVIII